jgi:hypothetical protein
MNKQGIKLCDKAAGRRLSSSTRRARLSALVVMMVIAAGVMAGESWVIKNAPATAVACELAQASDFARALDATVAARTTKVSDQRSD